MRRKQFAELAEVTPGAITLAIKRGKLKCEEDGSIDPTSASAEKYLKEQKAKRSPMINGGRPHQTASRKAKALDDLDLEIPTIVDVPAVNLPDSDLIDFDRPELYIQRFAGDPVLQDKIAATVKKIVEIKRHEQMRAKAAGELIDREYVAKRFAQFGESLRTQILTLPRRAAAQVTARAKAGGERDVEEYLTEEISAGITRALEDLGIE